MSSVFADVWSEKLEDTLAGYDVALVRAIASRLLKTRSQWPADELRERVRDAVGNPPVIDRRLKELPVPCRKLLAFIGLSRRPEWKVGHLIEVLATLGHAEGMAPLQTLFDEGLLYPADRLTNGRLKSFEAWLTSGPAAEQRMFAHPQVTQRARHDDLGMPELPEATPTRPDVREADGLEWPMRLAVAWQQVGEAPLRRTLQRDFFKRDAQRLRADPLLAAPFADQLAPVPDAGLLAVAWAQRAGVLRELDADLIAGEFDGHWDDGVAALLVELWRCLPEIDAWDAANGWEVGREGGNPFPTLYPLALLLLGRQQEEKWLRPRDVGTWLAEQHPYWADPGRAGEWVNSLLLGLLYQLKLVQAAPGADGEWLVRLSSFARRLLAGERSSSDASAFPQTLMVQANFEVLVFRQGLSPRLIADLTRFARWKSLGTACLMELVADQVYRGLESGMGLDDIRLLLQRHGMRAVPDNVGDALRTWSNKRERIVVYADATIVEFATPDDLEEAVHRGLIEIKLNDRLGLVRDEESLDYRQFRLTGRRDYGERMERCLTVGEDGLTLFVDSGRADLLLETELARVADPVDQSLDRRSFRLSRASLQRAVSSGWPLHEVDEWLLQRAGQSLSPAARFLASPPETVEFRVESCLVLHAPTPAVADALMQWPMTAGLIRERLGPTALVVNVDDVIRLREVIEGIEQRFPAPPA